ncbi:hypothetical protein M5K25_003687 [Dendrobium thyrsiflorum]|uniref:Uncharacterized protein n=1 Tax=Dendrobium thyrsiflorum TaxID=117978 RepID=A0ABD0VK51_DENTH
MVHPISLPSLPSPLHRNSTITLSLSLFIPSKVEMPLSVTARLSSRELDVPLRIMYYFLVYVGLAIMHTLKRVRKEKIDFPLEEDDRFEIVDQGFGNPDPVATLPDSQPGIWDPSISAQTSLILPMKRNGALYWAMEYAFFSRKSVELAQGDLLKLMASVSASLTILLSRANPENCLIATHAVNDHPCALFLAQWEEVGREARGEAGDLPNPVFGTCGVANNHPCALLLARWEEVRRDACGEAGLRGLQQRKFINKNIQLSANLILYQWVDRVKGVQSIESLIDLKNTPMMAALNFKEDEAWLLGRGGCRCRVGGDGWKDRVEKPDVEWHIGVESNDGSLAERST